MKSKKQLSNDYIPRDMECILVVGFPGCGKTSMIEQYVKGKSNIKVVNFGRELKHDYTSKQSDSIYKKFVLNRKDEAQKNDFSKIIIEGYPANIVQADYFVSKLSKYFYATLVIGMGYSPENHKKLMTSSSQAIKNKILYYSAQTKLGLFLINKKAAEHHILCREIILKPDNIKYNYNQFTRVISEFDSLVKASKEQTASQEQNEELQPILDLTNPHQITDLLIDLYSSNDIPDAKECLPYLLAYKNKQQGK